MPCSNASLPATTPRTNHPPARAKRTPALATTRSRGAQSAPMAGRSTRPAMLANARNHGPCSARPEPGNRVQITIPQKSRGQKVPGIPNNGRRPFNLVLTHSTKLNAPSGCALHKAVGRLNLVFGARVPPFEPVCRMGEPTRHKPAQRATGIPQERIPGAIWSE